MPCDTGSIEQGALTMTRHPNFTTQPMRLAALATAALVLSGCHFTVTDVHEQEAGYDTEVTSSLARYDTSFLVRSALVPFALSATGINMIADPDSYLTPSARMAARSHVPVETTSTYLFDSGACDFGGQTSIDAYGETETYDDSMTFVTMDVTARAIDCDTRNWQGYVTLNSRLDFDAIGWYDDYYDRIESLDSKMTGRLRMQAENSDLNYTNINSEMVELTSTDFRIEATASVWLDDGWRTNSASLSTTRGVHWYLNATQPHAGKVRLTAYRGWVDLEFSEYGVSRIDSNGYRDSIAWSSLR
jgi:hypothetical protein